ncbi:MAG: BatD family protein [Victivallales bacterium]|nr:BatD family protein [Victivallales bacterium]
MPQRQEPIRLGIDSQDIFLGETVTFQIQVSVDDDSKDKVVMPDFPESQDYTVVARPPSTGTSSFTSIVNGKRTESHTTNTTYSYQITPKRIGQVTLPSMTIKIGSKTYRTQEVPITVRKAEKLDDLKVTMTVSNPSCYVGESVMLNWRWEIARDVKDFQFSLPVLEMDAFSYPEVEPKIDQTRRNEFLWIPLASGEKLLGRRRSGPGGSTIIEFSQPMVTKRAGEFELPPSVVICAVYDERAGRQQRHRGGWPFDDDDFPSFFGPARPTRRVSVQSDPVKFTVKELPAAGRPKSFSGIVGKCSLMTMADPLEVSVGDPIQLTLQLSGPAYLETVKLPSLSSQEALAEHFKISGEDDPGVVEGDVKKFTRILRANDVNVKEIPAIEISYFDSETGKYEIARSPAIPLQVQAAKQVTAQDAEGLRMAGAVAAAPKLESEVKVREGGLVNNYAVRELLANERLKTQSLLKSPVGLAVLAGMPLLYLVVFGIGWMRSVGLADPAAAASRRAGGRCMGMIDTAEKSNDALSGVLDALRQYLGAKLHMTGDALTFGDVHEPLRRQGVDDALLGELKDLFTRCEESRYAGGGSLDGATACRRAREIVRKLESLKLKP